MNCLNTRLLPVNAHLLITWDSAFYAIIPVDVSLKLLDDRRLGPVVQSSVSLTSSLVVKMLTVLVSAMSNSQVFLQKKCE